VSIDDNTSTSQHQDQPVASPLRRLMKPLTSRRISLQFTFPSSNSSADHSAAEGSVQSPREVFRDAVDRIRQLTLPVSLLRHKDKQTANKNNARALFPFLTTTLTIPFYAFLRDEHDRKGIPILLELVSVRVRTDQAEEGSSFCIDLTYGDLQWTIRRTMVSSPV
jgi:hypothetical protein